jgi:uncharacterized membrane protein YoaK (UPF0700 family)
MSHRKYETVGPYASPMRDFVREFHPTADQEYANRRFSEQPTMMSVQTATICLTFFVGGLCGAVITLFFGV